MNGGGGRWKLPVRADRALLADRTEPAAAVLGLTGFKYLRREGKLASRTNFEHMLAKVPNVPPKPGAR